MAMQGKIEEIIPPAAREMNRRPHARKLAEDAQGAGG